MNKNGTLIVLLAVAVVVGIFFAWFVYNQGKAQGEILPKQEPVKSHLKLKKVNPNDFKDSSIFND